MTGICCASHGVDGVPVLAVHGWGDSGAAWEPLLPGLTAVGQTLVPDLPGHGRSAPSADWRPRAMADELAGLLRARGAGPVVAIGHSMGGQVVSALAVEHPEMVAASVVIDPAYGADDAEMALAPGRLAALRARGAAAALGVTGDALPAGYRARLLATPGYVLAGCFAGMYTDPDAFGAREYSERYLARRRQPVLALYSREEPAAWESALPAHPRSDVVVWPAEGHFLHLRRPGEFTGVLHRWLGSSLGTSEAAPGRPSHG